MSNPYAPPACGTIAVQRRGYYFAVLACHVCVWWAAARREGDAGTWTLVAMAVGLFIEPAADSLPQALRAE